MIGSRHRREDSKITALDSMRPINEPRAEPSKTSSNNLMDYFQDLIDEDSQAYQTYSN